MGVEDANGNGYRISFWMVLGAGALGLSACFVDSYDVPSEGSGGEGGGATTASSVTGSGTGTGGGGSTCAASEVCAPSVDGWEGPYRTRGGVFGQLGPCPNGNMEVYKGAFDPVQAMGSCSCDCNCTGMGCSPPSITCWDNTTCQDGVPSLIMQFGQAGCYPIPVTSAMPPGSCLVTTLPAPQAATSCAPNNPKLPNLPAWKQAAQVCEAGGSGAACGGGTCVAAEESGDFPKAICVVKQDDASCPSEYNHARTVVYQDWKDSRTCGNCQANKNAVKCSAPGISPASQMCSLAYDGGSEACISMQYQPAIDYAPPSVGMLPDACTAAVVGQVEPLAPLTICCKSL